MSTNYTFDGEIEIKPPLNFAEICTARKIALGLTSQGYARKHATEDNVFEQYMPLALKLDTYEETTDRGVLVVTSAATMRAPKADWWLPIKMDVLVKALIEALPGHEWNGTVTAVHEERTTGEKVVVKFTRREGESGHLVRLVKGETYMKWENDDPDDEGDRLADLL